MNRKVEVVAVYSNNIDERGGTDSVKGVVVGPGYLAKNSFKPKITIINKGLRGIKGVKQWMAWEWGNKN